MNAKTLLDEIVEEIKKIRAVNFGAILSDGTIEVCDESGSYRGPLSITISWNQSYVSYKFYSNVEIESCWFRSESRSLEDVRREFVENFVKYVEKFGIVTHNKQYIELLSLIEELATETPHLTGKGAEYLKQLRVHLANSPGGSEYEKTRESFERLANN
nr:hypothetical protein K-LCC10_0281 [Kaumoebavirus]